MTPAIVTYILTYLYGVNLSLGARATCSQIEVGATSCRLPVSLIFFTLTLSTAGEPNHLHCRDGTLCRIIQALR